MELRLFPLLISLAKGYITSQWKVLNELNWMHASNSNIYICIIRWCMKFSFRAPFSLFSLLIFWCCLRYCCYLLVYHSGKLLLGAFGLIGYFWCIIGEVGKGWQAWNDGFELAHFWQVVKERTTRAVKSILLCESVNYHEIFLGCCNIDFTHAHIYKLIKCFELQCLLCCVYLAIIN